MNRLIGANYWTKKKWEECKYPTVPSMCLRIQTQQSRPLNGLVSFPLSMEPVNPVPPCDLDQVLLKDVMAENRGFTFFDVEKRSPEHLSATLTGCESHDDDLEPASVKEDADNQLSEIASSIPPVDPSCVELKNSVFLAQLLLEEVELESTSEPTSPVGKPVLHMQHTTSCETVSQSPDVLGRPASNNMPLSEHDTQELR